MSTLKTLPNNSSAIAFLETLDDEKKKADSLVLLDLFEKVTGEKPKMWGTSIVGYGMYHYKSERSSQEGDWPLTGFSPRKQNLTLYVMLGVENFKELLPKLGKHTSSSGSCLYIKKLDDVDLNVLEEIIKRSYEHAKKTLLK